MLVFSDIAGTIVEGNPWDYLREHPDYDVKKGERALRRFLPIYVGNKLNLVSDVVFRDRWLKRMAEVLKGQSRQQILATFSDIIDNRMADLYHDDVIARLRQHQADGWRVVLVSGMFVDVGRLFAERIGADDVLGTGLAFDDNDICLGRVQGETCVGPRKVQFMQQYAASLPEPVELSDCTGYADSYSDVSLLQAMGRGVATYPDDNLRNVALSNQWEIIPAS